MKNDTVQRYLDLIYRYKDDVYRIIINVVREHYLAEEMTQIVLVNAWKGFSTMKEPDKSKAWVKGITRNVIRQYMREKQIYLSMEDRNFMCELENIETVKSIEKDILDAVVEKENIKNVFAALDSLSENHSRIIREHLIGDVTLKDIADRNGLNPGTVRMMYYRAMEALRDAYLRIEKGGNLNG